MAFGSPSTCWRWWGLPALPSGGGIAAVCLPVSLVSLPLSYSLGFALATTSMDHRYLFPSTLLMQGIVLAYAAAGAGKLIRRRPAAGP